MMQCIFEALSSSAYSNKTLINAQALTRVSRCLPRVAESLAQTPLPPMAALLLARRAL